MNPIAYKIENLSPVEYFKKHLEIVTTIMPGKITEKEIEVLASFMALTGDVIEKDRFGTSARKIVMEQLNLKAGGLGNHLRSLRDNRYIYHPENSKSYEINKWLIPDNKKFQKYQFTIVSNE